MECLEVRRGVLMRVERLDRLGSVERSAGDADQEEPGGPAHGVTMDASRLSVRIGHSHSFAGPIQFGATTRQKPPRARRRHPSKPGGASRTGSAPLLSQPLTTVPLFLNPSIVPSPLPRPPPSCWLAATPQSSAPWCPPPAPDHRSRVRGTLERLRPAVPSQQTAR